MKNQQDIALIFAAILALAVLTLLAHMAGAKEAVLKMEKQAIANGAATYNEQGQFKWIKK
jgi:hypothetical protein